MVVVEGVVRRKWGVSRKIGVFLVLDGRNEGGLKAYIDIPWR